MSGKATTWELRFRWSEHSVGAAKCLERAALLFKRPLLLQQPNP